MSVTSPLTSYASASTPRSYATAPNSPSHDPDTTGISSPDADAEAYQNAAPHFRRAVQPALELKNQCQIHFEEDLFLPAALLLDNLLADGSSISAKGTLCPPARVAPTSQLAFLSTLTIHPSYSSRPQEPYNLHASTRALAYLRAVLRLVGPVNADFRSAFRFKKPGRYQNRVSRRDRTSTSGSTSPAGSTSGSESESIMGRLANEQSIWQRGGTFWAVLGWAFRCAAEHPDRWKHWQVWLDFVIEVLEKDWDVRMEMEKEEAGDSQEMDRGRGRLRESIIVGFLADVANRNVLKEVLKALMAFSDDDPADKGVYNEVFEQELAAAKGKSKRKREAAGQAEEDTPMKLVSLADWALEEELESEESERSTSPTPMTRTIIRPTRSGRGGTKQQIVVSTSPTPTFRVTDALDETIPFRLRIFRLLFAVADSLPSCFCPVVNLYEEFTNRVCNLPVPMFQYFMDWMQTMYSDSDKSCIVYISLLRSFAEKLLPAKRPDPFDVDFETEQQGGISIALLEKCFLPFAASRVIADENAKLSLVLEGMVWTVYVAEQLSDEEVESLENAVEKGIKARGERIRKRNSGLGPVEKEAKAALDRSSKSLRLFVHLSGLGR